MTDDAGNLDAMRYTLVSRLVPQPLRGAPGERFECSSLGYTLAGAMVEEVTGKTWEELVVARRPDGHHRDRGKSRHCGGVHHRRRGLYAGGKVLF